MTADTGTGVSRSQGRRTATLDGLRGIAVIAVVLEHTSSSLLPGGFAGVDVFFVLSGFLITGLLAAGADRTGRLGPVAVLRAPRPPDLPRSLLAVGGTVLLGLFILGPLGPPDTAIDPWPPRSRSRTSCSPRARRTTSRIARRQSPFLHYWSLAVEEQFYLIWPAMLLILVTVVRRVPSATGASGA